MDIKEVLRYIKDADAEDLELISPAVIRRQVELKNERVYRLMGQLNKGDRVRLRGIKPKYMNGQEGIFQAALGNKASVLMDRSTPRFGRTPRVPLTCLEKVT